MINMLFSLYNFHESWASDIVAKYINCNDKVLIIPFSFNDQISNDKDWQDSYSKENAKDKIRNSNIIFFTGGLPDKMMSRLIEFDLIDDIEKFIGIIIGCSAGAMVQIAEYHITPDEDYNTFTYNTGLNMINNFDIEVHYEGTEVQNKYIKKVLVEKKDKIYAITNNGGLVVDNEKITLLGDTKTFNK